MNLFIMQPINFHEKNSSGPAQRIEIEIVVNTTAQLFRLTKIDTFIK